MEDDYIPTDALNFEIVPAEDAEIGVLEEFCLTIDGYQGGRLPPDDLLPQAERVERGGLENASLDDLRTAAFIRQRELRATSMDSGHYDEQLVRSIRELVGEIRRRLTAAG